MIFLFCLLTFLLALYMTDLTTFIVYLALTVRFFPSVIFMFVVVAFSFFT